MRNDALALVSQVEASRSGVSRRWRLWWHGRGGRWQRREQRHGRGRQWRRRRRWGRRRRLCRRRHGRGRRDRRGGWPWAGRWRPTWGPGGFVGAVGSGGRGGPPWGRAGGGGLAGGPSPRTRRAA